MQNKHIKRLLSCIAAMAVMLSAPGAFAEGEMSLDEIRRSLTFSALTSQSITEVTENFILPVDYEGAFVVWESDNENAICIDGGSADLWARVIRPPFGEGYVSATLTAYITKDGEMTKKSFLVRVKELDIGFTYSETMKETYRQFEMEFLSRQDIFGITDDLYLPNIKIYDNVKITFKSDNPSVIADDGKVTRNFDEDSSVSFTAYFTEGFETFKVCYPITVRAYADSEINNTVQKDLEEAIAALKTKYNLMALTSDIDLPAGGSGGSAIHWSSSDSTVISASGEVSRSDETKTAVLTATASFHGATATGTVDVAASKKGTQASETKDNVGIDRVREESSGGGGGGGTYVPPSADKDGENVFDDVAPTYWGYDAISYLAQKGVINGIDENIFAPESYVTREQAVKIIMLGLGFDVDENVQETGFADTQPGAWYAPYIRAARDADVVKGISESEFGIGRRVTRQELAAMIYRAVQKADIELSSSVQTAFADSADIDGWAADSVNALAAAGIINGRDGSFYPDEGATRAEISAMIYRLLD